MRRIAIAATFALFSLGSVTTANAQTHACNQNGQVAGGVIGALVGGTAGGLIANDGRRSFRSNRSFRGDRGFRRGGFKGGRGFRGRRGFRRNNNGVGIIVGALAGGLIGSQLGAANTQNCIQQNRRRGARTAFGGTRQQRSNPGSAPFGGQQPFRTQPVNTPASAPAPLQPPQQNSRVFQPVCQFVTQTTQLPNGQSTSQEVEVCQFSPDGEWIPR